MSPLAWMIGASLLSWLLITLVAARSLNPELFWGMLGPLVSAVITWIAVARTHRAAPERVMGVLMAGFGVKLVFFGLYLFAVDLALNNAVQWVINRFGAA